MKKILVMAKRLMCGTAHSAGASCEPELDFLLSPGNRLSHAISIGDAEAFKSLVGDDPSLAKQYTFHRRPTSIAPGAVINTLRYIVECGSQEELLNACKEMILFALECGADINAREEDAREEFWRGLTPLEIAIYSYSFRLIPFLIEHGARPVKGWRVNTLTYANIVSVFQRYNGGPLKVEGAELQDIIDGLATFESKTQKNTLLRELDVASDELEGRPLRRM
ncbi:hypothetical protein [Stenotrophomonas sp. S39]|uniref:hypothetical protein n=1 Tax=Stenotrophomonas sp. S39 TaxID=2767451 RepID=UPI00190BA9EC|nr:hypothetical protein [Stenotrophomonas sp. S39]MBK0052994.1 hypothetical protein [Stenotrophomonas sp. S39]